MKKSAFAADGDEMKKQAKHSFKLYNYSPAVAVLLFSPIGFLPVIGGLAVNLLFSVVAVLIIQRRFSIKTILKTAGVNYLTAISVLYAGVCVVLVFSSLVFLMDYSDDVGFHRMVETVVAAVWFIAGINAIFAVSFFYSAKQFFGGAGHSKRTRAILAVLLTLLNAPYLLFIPYEQAVYVDFKQYSKYVDEKAHEEQRSWESDDGILSFNTVERFHRFRAADYEGGQLDFRFDGASGKTFTISFNDRVDDTGGYYNRGDFRVYYRSSGGNAADYHQLLSGSYYRTSADKLVLEVKSIDDNAVKSPYKAGDAVFLHTI